MQFVTRDALRVGFIGGGVASAVGRAHFTSCRLDGHFEVVAGAFSQAKDRIAETAREWRIDPSRAYDSVESLLESETGRLDCVVVLSPTPNHFEHVRQALTSGYDVICEKSLGVQSSEAHFLDRLATLLNRKLFVTFNYSGYPMVRELQKFIERGLLGRILAVQVEMPQEGFLRKDSAGNSMMPQRWRQEDGVLPTVCLDLGTHTHHLTTFLLGMEPIELVASLNHHGHVRDVVDYVSLLARYPENIDVTMNFGKVAIGHRNGLSIRVYGEDGAATWIQTNPEELEFARGNGNREIVDRSSPTVEIARDRRYERFKAGHPAGFVEAFGNIYQDIFSVLHDPSHEDRRYVSLASHAARGLEMMEQAVISHRTRQWVAAGGAC